MPSSFLLGLGGSDDEEEAAPMMIDSAGRPSPKPPKVCLRVPSAAPQGPRPEALKAPKAPKAPNAQMLKCSNAPPRRNE
ncbi:hypothetical protein VDGL01_04090 [Verticillium dahliae]